MIDSVKFEDPVGEIFDTGKDLGEAAHQLSKEIDNPSKAKKKKAKAKA